MVTGAGASWRAIPSENVHGNQLSAKPPGQPGLHRRQPPGLGWLPAICNAIRPPQTGHLAALPPSAAKMTRCRSSRAFRRVTTGTPIGLLIRQYRPAIQRLFNIKDTFRPPTPITPTTKIRFRDYRGGRRSSAGEPPCGWRPAPSRKIPGQRYGIVIRGYLAQLGPIVRAAGLGHGGNNPFFVPTRPYGAVDGKSSWPPSTSAGIPHRRQDQRGGQAA